MIIAGEASGDLHGASLIRELKILKPGLNICGIGGDRMKSEGMTADYHVKEMAFLGFAEIVKHIPFIRKVQNDLLDKLIDRRINNLVLIDYPGFNLSFAKKAKKAGVDIIYYISPQIWAWGKGRIKKIKKLIDKMIVVFPFEKEIYEKAGIDAEYVGHPLIERIDNHTYMTKEEIFRKFNLDGAKEILLLMPGSREQEIRQIFPSIIGTAERLASAHGLQIVVSVPENIDPGIYGEIHPSVNYRVIGGHAYDLMKHAEFGIIKSGTSTLEAGLLALPFVIVYSTGYLTYQIGRRLIKLSSIGMVNIIAGGKIIDEFIQHDLKGEKLYDRCNQILNSHEEYKRIRDDLGIIRRRLGGAGASKRAAEIIKERLDEGKRVV